MKYRLHTLIISLLILFSGDNTGIRPVAQEKRARYFIDLKSHMNT